MTATVLIFCAVGPTASFAQDKCRTPADQAEINRLQAEIEKLEKQRAQIEIDRTAHKARYDELLKGWPQTTKLVDEADRQLSEDNKRDLDVQQQMIKDYDAQRLLLAKPCPPPPKNTGAPEPPPLAPPPTPKPVVKKCRTPEAEAELKRLKDQRWQLDSKITGLKGPIKRAARDIGRAKKAAQEDPIGHGADTKAAEDKFNDLERQKQDAERELKSVTIRINRLEELSPCPPPPAKTDQPAKPEQPAKTDTPPDTFVEPPKLAPAEVVPPQSKSGAETPHADQPASPPPDLKPQQDT
ncbi:MAG: hypothetical protein ACTHLR_03595 [Rhizomicrobium sp.]